MTQAADAMQATVLRFLHEHARQIATDIGRLMVEKVEKTDADQEALRAARDKRLQEILDDLDFTFWDDLPGEVEQYLVAVAKDGAREALMQMTADAITVESAVFDQANADAIEWAKDRAAELVGMKRVDGELVPNPNARWQIDTDTREGIRDTVASALEDGWSNDKLASELQDAHAFNDARAENIARTETARADIQGSLVGYRATGMVAAKQWLTAPDCCDECLELDGVVVPLEDDFPKGGGDGAPLHPQCRCDVLPVLTTEQENDE